MVNNSDFGSGGRGFEPHSGRRVVSLSKTYLPPPPPPKKKKKRKKCTGNTQEAVALFQHDLKNDYRDVKNQTNQAPRGREILLNRNHTITNKQ